MPPKGKPILFNSHSYKNRYLSNFYFEPFTASDGKSYMTVEHYYQAMKFEGTAYAETIRNAETPVVARRLGGSRDYPIREDWEAVKEQVMRDALRAKFTQNEGLKRKLLDNTEESPLIHDAQWDGYWGSGVDGRGKNMLGVMLMELRDQLRKAEADTQAQEQMKAQAQSQEELIESLKQEIERLKQEITELKEHRWMKIGRALEEVTSGDEVVAKRARTEVTVESEQS